MNTSHSNPQPSHPIKKKKKPNHNLLFKFPQLSHTLTCTHTRTHMHTHVHTHTHVHMHTNTRTHTHKQTKTHINNNTETQSLALKANRNAHSLEGTQLHTSVPDDKSTNSTTCIRPSHPPDSPAVDSHPRQSTHTLCVGPHRPQHGHILNRPSKTWLLLMFGSSVSDRQGVQGQIQDKPPPDKSPPPPNPQKERSLKGGVIFCEGFSM